MLNLCHLGAQHDASGMFPQCSFGGSMTYTWRGAAPVAVMCGVPGWAAGLPRQLVAERGWLGFVLGPRWERNQDAVTYIAVVDSDLSNIECSEGQPEPWRPEH